jgi:hypothetical protein
MSLRSSLPEPIKALFRPTVRRAYSLLGELRVSISHVEDAIGCSIIHKRDPLDPKQVTFRDVTGRRPVSHEEVRGPDVAVILALGQSNIANECDPHALIRPAANVYNLNFLDGRIYAAEDPLLGTTHARSNILTRLGLRLMEEGHYRKVLLVPIAHGASFIAWWAPRGLMVPRLKKAIEVLQALGTRPTHILIQQGESEANNNPTEATRRAWERDFRKLAAMLRRHGLKAPVYVATCTLCGYGPNELIRRAQQAVVSPDEGIFAGPDLDTIADRWDGCHFSQAGMDKAVSLWMTALMKDPVAGPQTSTFHVSAGPR